jgi:preprotein translocase subunit SecF
MSWLGRINRGETAIDFVGLRKRWFTISTIAVLVSALAMGLIGLNLGIEFVGGLGIQTPNHAGVDITEVRTALEEVGISDATVQFLDEDAAVRVTTRELDQATERAAIDAMADLTGAAPGEISIEAVGPTFGALIARRALLALAVFLGAVVLFISWRLEFKMAVAGLVALFHDLLITVGIYSLTGFQVTPATVVAILVVMGYSLYDTVVVFDKVEELVESEEELTYTEIVNQSMNSVLARSLATSLTSLLPVGSILFVGSFVLGAPTLRDFALALFVGIAVGTYSSIFLASPILAVWKEKEPAWIERSEWVERRSRSGRR